MFYVNTRAKWPARNETVEECADGREAARLAREHNAADPGGAYYVSRRPAGSWTDAATETEEGTENAMNTGTTERRYTIADVKAANEAAGRYFFSRDTLRFFGDRVAYWGVRHIGGRVYLARKRAPEKDRSKRCEIREFNPRTGEIGLPLTRQEAPDVWRSVYG